METLPHELVAVIGANLLPRDYCRLFICRKEWYKNCYISDVDLYKWYNNIYKSLVIIRNIKYSIWGVDNGYSRLVNPHGHIVHTSLSYDDYGDGNLSMTIIIKNGSDHFEFIDGIKIVAHNDNKDDCVLATYNYYMSEHLYFKKRAEKEGPIKYKIYKCLELLGSYCTDGDILKCAVAFGWNVYNMHYIRSYLNSGPWPWRLD